MRKPSKTIHVSVLQIHDAKKEFIAFARSGQGVIESGTTEAEALGKLLLHHAEEWNVCIDHRDAMVITCGTTGKAHHG